MPRERIEDLGRLAVMIHNLIEKIDEVDKPRRPKDCHEWYESKTQDQKDDVINSYCYLLENLQQHLYKLLAIAEGTDDLNSND